MFICMPHQLQWRSYTVWNSRLSNTTLYDAFHVRRSFCASVTKTCDIWKSKHTHYCIPRSPTEINPETRSCLDKRLLHKREDRMWWTQRGNFNVCHMSFCIDLLSIILSMSPHWFISCMCSFCLKDVFIKGSWGLFSFFHQMHEGHF